MIVIQYKNLCVPLSTSCLAHCLILSNHFIHCRTVLPGPGEHMLSRHVISSHALTSFAPIGSFEVTYNPSWQICTYRTRAPVSSRGVL